MLGLMTSSTKLEGLNPRRIPKEGATKKKPHWREKAEKRVEGGGGGRRGREEEGRGEEKLRKRPAETPVFLDGILNWAHILLTGLELALT